MHAYTRNIIQKYTIKVVRYSKYFRSPKSIKCYFQVLPGLNGRIHTVEDSNPRVVRPSIGPDALYMYIIDY